jgi:Flp pilus assembly protein TadG
MFRRLSRLAKAKAGNVSLVFALSAIPLVLAGGGALDMARLISLRTQLQDAADAAALSAITANSAAMLAAGSMSGDGPIAAGSTQAQTMFTADIAAANATVTSLSTPVTKTGRSVSAVVTATATIPSLFLGVMGKTTLTATVTSSAANSLPTYIDFYVLLDNTPSMGVGATPADVATMVAHTSDQCAFACHDLSNPGGNYYTLAKSLGVTTRIDVLRTATQSLMTTAQATETTPNQFKMGIYTFGASSSAIGFYTLTTPISNLATASTVASTIDLMTVPYQNYNNDEDTDFAAVLTGANSAIPTPGDGSSSSKAQKVLFLVSDGVNDSNISGNRVISTLDTGYCTQIKNRGIKIAVLYTTYLPLPTNQFYNDNVAPFVNTINPTMKACATSGLFFEVSPTQGISDAMNALFQKAVALDHITN